MNTYFIGIAAILTVKWYYDIKKNNEMISLHNDRTIIKKNHYDCLAHTLSNNSSDNLHKERWNNDNCSSSQNKW